MNSIDIGILILLGVNTFGGFRQGLINALARLIGWVASFIIAIRYRELLLPWLQNISPQPLIQNGIAFILVIVIVMFITTFAAKILQQIFQFIKLSWLNRLAGAAFGLVKSLVIVLILIHILAPWLSGVPLWKESELIGQLQPHAASTTEHSQKIVQITTERLESYQSDENNRRHGAIISNEKSDGHRQIENPFQ